MAGRDPGSVQQDGDLSRTVTDKLHISGCDDASSLKSPTRTKHFEKHSSPKPPTIMVYCGKDASVRTFKSIHDALSASVKFDSYTVYQLRHEQADNTPWQESTVLLVVACEDLDEGISDVFLNYMSSGGQMLSFGSAIEKRFIKFKKVIEQSELSSFSLLKSSDSVKCLRGLYNYEESVLNTSDWTMTVFAQDKFHDNQPVIVGISSHPENKTDMGKAVFSQMFLYKDQAESAMSKDVFEQLKSTNQVRIKVFQSLLIWLGVECDQSSTVALTTASLLAQEEKKRSFLDSLKGSLKDGCLKSQTLTMKFVEADTSEDLPVSSSFLPVVCTTETSSQHKYFKQQVYWDNLKTSELGNVVIYADVIPTTMALFESLQFTIPEDLGLAVIAGRQTAGKGRGGNAWLSPEGCALFSLLVRVPINSLLGQKISFMQHITPLAVVNSVTSMQGYEKINVNIKWPNDIYYSNKIKLGGVLVDSTIMGKTICAVIGCGFNVSNSNPTICVNDIITQYNDEHKTSLSLCSTDQLIARIISQIEMLMTDFQTHGHEQFCERYYKSWLHSNKRVKIEGGQDVTIVGLDDYGYLKVETENGTYLSLQQDGNTFDMMHNLIRRK